jgi:heme/copper-type cytochrome/quinol oxidase subunit 2
MSTPDQPPVPAPAPAPAAPAKKSNTLVIVLCVILGLMLVVIGGCVATCVYVGKKAKEYAKESEKNPKISALALAATIAPGVEVVSKDLDAGTIVLRNKKTGETVKIDAASFSEDRIAEVLEKVAQGKNAAANARKEAAATPAEQPTANESPAAEVQVSAAQSAAQTATLKKFPADFPVYTSGGAKTLEATQQTFAGMSSAQHVFETSDSPSEVADFFGKKLTAAGYVVRASENGSDDHGPTATCLYQKDGVNVTFNLTAHVEDGKTHVEVSHVQLKQ